MPEIDPALAPYVDAYVTGWAHSRGAPSPRPVTRGWHVPTGTATEPERLVLTCGTPDEVREAARSLPRPGSCLKFAGARDDWLWLAGNGWEENPLGWFMTRDLTPTAATDTPPPGHTLHTTADDNLVTVEIRHAGAVAASARAGLAGDWAVPDRVRTHPAHRRRGLGRLVMDHLLALAHTTGARHAVLDASPEGRHLYLASGWRVVSGQFGVTRVAGTETRG